MPAEDAPPRKLTYEDYCLIPEDGQRHEILDGVEVVTPAPTWSHQRILGRLFYLLESWCKETGHGTVLFAPFDCLLSRHDILQPDLLWISPENHAILTDANAQGAPDLVAEVLSPSTRRRDLTLKRERYALGGVREYWVIDPEAERLEVFRRSGEELTKAEELWNREGQVLRPERLPGLELRVAELFRA